jgi:hypothetical protein
MRAFDIRLVLIIRFLGLFIPALMVIAALAP